MDTLQLHPWILRADGREDRRPLVWVDLETWPPELPLEPLPPCPVVAVGAADHPQAVRTDVRVESRTSLQELLTRVEAAPLASAALVGLLRAIEDVPAASALTLESFAFAMLQGGAEHAAWLVSRSAAPTKPPGRLDMSRTGGTLDLVLDRPAAFNAIDRALRDALFDAFTLAALDPAVERVRLRARGRAFSLGADLSEFGVTRDPTEAHAIRARTLPAHALLRRRCPFEAHVQGACVGAGLELAAFADRVTASPGAWFQLPEMRMGVLPGFGGCVSVPRRIGRQQAAALMLSGRRIGAQTALRWGLIDAIVDEAPVHEGR